MNYTSIEQSKKLVELGLKPETADMYYHFYYDSFSQVDGNYCYTPEIIRTKCHWKYNRVNCFGDTVKYPDIPCWSVGALLQLMPKVISVPVDERSSYFYNLEWQFANDNSLRYIATNRSKCVIDIYSDHDIGKKSFIETAFEMIVWLLENGYIKQKRNDTRRDREIQNKRKA